MEKQNHKSGEEIIKEAEEKKRQEKLVENANRKRVIVREKVYPLLLDLNEDIRYSKIFVHTGATAIRQAFDNLMLTMKVSELNIEQYFDPKNEKLKDYHRLFEILKDETINDALSIVREMPDKIDNFFFHEMEKKRINELDIDKLLG